MAQEIKITQNSNADMNIGVPKNLTAVSFLEERIKLTDKETYAQLYEDIQSARHMEEKQITEAITYALDEDGHTGDCRHKIIQSYINNIYNK